MSNKEQIKQFMRNWYDYTTALLLVFLVILLPVGIFFLILENFGVLASVVWILVYLWVVRTINRRLDI